MNHTVSPEEPDNTAPTPEAESVWTDIPPMRPYRADACDDNPEEEEDNDK